MTCMAERSLQRLFLIFMMSVLDGALTILLVDRGFEELNPFMAGLLGSVWFWIAKLFLTGLGCAILYAIKARRVTDWIQAGYALVITYEVMLLLVLR